MMKRRNFLKLTAAASAAPLFAPSIVRAQGTFPNGPIQLIVPFAPGGGADRTFRLFAPYLADELGQSVNVVNIAGGGGWVAWQQMANWDPQDDALKLGTINLPNVFSYLDPRMQRQETIDSFNLLAWHSLDPCIWAMRADEDRFTDLPSFLTYVKEHPGEIILSSTAVGSDDHMGIAYAEKFIPDFEVKKIYSNGDSEKIQEVLSDVSDVVAGNVGYFNSFVEDEKLKWLTILNRERYEETPDLPTFKEVTGKENVSFAGRTICVANGLPQEQQDIYLKAIGNAIKNPEYVAKEKANHNNLLFLTGDKMNDLIQSTREYVESVEFWKDS